MKSHFTIERGDNTLLDCWTRRVCSRPVQKCRAHFLGALALSSARLRFSCCLASCPLPFSTPLAPCSNICTSQLQGSGR